MKKVIRLTESDLMRIVKRVIRENAEGPKEIPTVCNQSTVKSVSETEAKSKKGQPGYHAWREIEGPTPQYFLCRTKSGGEMEEGWLGDKLKGLKRFSRGYGDEGELESKRDEFMSKLAEFDDEVMENPEDYVKGDRWDEYRKELIAKARDNNFMGSLRRRTSPNSDKYFIVYFPGTTGLQNMASGAAGSVRSGMSNTNISESRRRYLRRLNEGSLIGQPIGTTGYKLTDASGMGSPICQVTVSIQNIKNPSDVQTFTDGQGGLEKINKLTNQSLKNELLNIRAAKRRELGCN